MKRTIKFRGKDMSGHFEYGLLTKKKLRSCGEIVWALAKGDCRAANTVPVREDSIAQLVGLDKNGEEVYEGDLLKTPHGGELIADMSLCSATDLCTLKKPDEKSGGEPTD